MNTQTVSDAHTGQDYEVGYDKSNDAWFVDGLPVTRNEALENEDGVGMFIGGGAVAHLPLDELAAIKNASE